jgi:hypothetical protein
MEKKWGAPSFSLNLIEIFTFSSSKTDKSKRDRLFFWREQKMDEIS